MKKILVMAAIGLLFTGGLQAQTFNLTSGTTNSWNTSGNWTPSGVPNAVGASVTFNSPTGTQTVNLNAAITVGSISVTNNSTSIFTLANGTGGSLTFDQTGASNAQFNVNGTSTTTNNVAVSAGVTLNDNLELNINNTAAAGSAAATFTGAVTGSGGLIKNGDGNFTLSTSAKTYNGATVINGGYLRFTATGTATGTSGITVNSGGQLRLDSNAGAFSFGTATINLNGAGSTGPLASQGALRNQASGATTLSNNVNIASDAAIHVNNGGNSLQLNGNLLGSGVVTKTGGGTLIINGAANTHTGGFAVTNGAVTAAASTTIGGPVTMAQALGNNTTFNINSSQTISGLASNWTDTSGSFTQTVNLNGAGTNLTVNQANNTTFGNGAVGTLTSVIAGVGGLTKSGAGKLTLEGANTYSGSTTVNGGTLSIASTGSISGSGVTVTGGTLNVNGQVNTTVNVANGGSLTGSGTISGATTIDGIHSPGNSPGLQTFAGGLTYNTGSSLAWELIGNTLVNRGVDFDGIDVTGGTLTINPGVTSNLVFNGSGSTVDWSNSFWNSDKQWLVFDNANAPSLSIASIFGTVNVSADSASQSLASIRSGASFSWSQTGNDIFLNYTITAVPEPSSLALIGVVFAGAAFVRRRK